jgi:hypothetical protein
MEPGDTGMALDLAEQSKAKSSLQDVPRLRNCWYQVFRKAEVRRRLKRDELLVSQYKVQ